jgi:hypothetical protein
MTNNSENSIDSRFRIFIKKLFFWLILVTPVTETIKYNSRLYLCSTIIGNKKGAKDNFKRQAYRSLLVLFLGFTPLVTAIIYNIAVYNINHDQPTRFFLIKNVFLKGWQSLYDSGIVYPAATISIMTVVLSYLLTLIVFFVLLRVYDVRVGTIKLREVAISMNLCDEKIQDRILWTKIGILMELKNGTAVELVKNATFWTQIDMEPGEIIYSKKSKTVFFILSGFELADEYNFTVKD